MPSEWRFMPLLLVMREVVVVQIFALRSNTYITPIVRANLALSTVEVGIFYRVL